MLKGGSGYRSLRLGRGGKQGAEGRGEGGAFSRLETPWSVAPLTPGHSGSPAPGGRGLGGDGLPGDGRLCPGFPKEPRAGRRAVYEVGEAQGLASAPRGGRWPGRCRGPGVVAWGGAGLCPRRGRHDAEVRGGLDDPRETQLGEGSDRPQRPAGAPGSPRAHRRQVGSGSCGLCWVPRPESGGNRPELLLRPEAACAPGDACQGGQRGRDPASSRWAAPTDAKVSKATHTLASPWCRAPASIVPPAQGKPREARDERASLPRQARVKDAKHPGAGPQSGTEERGSGPDPFQPVLPPLPHLTFSSKRWRFQQSPLPRILNARTGICGNRVCGEMVSNSGATP